MRRVVYAAYSYKNEIAEILQSTINEVEKEAMFDRQIIYNEEI